MATVAEARKVLTASMIKEQASQSGLNLMDKLGKDIVQASSMMTKNQARFLVDYYYIIQEDRKRSANQCRSLGENDEPHAVLSWLFIQADQMENTIRKVLGRWAAASKAGAWAQSICGIGDVISAGLLAHIDIEKAPTAGHIWRFAGLDNTVRWDSQIEVAKSLRDYPTTLSRDDLEAISKAWGRSPESMSQSILKTKPQNHHDALEELGAAGVKKTQVVKYLARRPFNMELKTLTTFKLGECFVKVSNNPKDIYGKIYKARKEMETERNERGDFAQQAADKLARFNIGKDTDAYAAYSEGKLPPAHIHARARRYAVKLFLAHFHEALWRQEYNTTPPKPYILTGRAKERGLEYNSVIKMPDPEGIFGLE